MSVTFGIKLQFSESERFDSVGSKPDVNGFRRRIKTLKIRPFQGLRHIALIVGFAPDAIEFIAFGDRNPR